MSLKESVSTLLKARPKSFLGRTEEIHEEPQAIESVYGFESKAL